ncbi:MAG: PilN domain-containing protein [Patescibacteria group bacterium]|nr:PilN domain-containing protein [Patescibacteria group bacterium]
MKYKINLLPEKEKSFIDKIVYFVFNYLRYIIVMTQLVVIGVFFYRFQIDQQVIDLRESVDQKKEIIKVVLPLLNETARVDKKTKEIFKIIRKQENFKSAINYVFSIIPESVVLTNLEVKGESFNINGQTKNPKEFQYFLNFLKKEKKFDLIQLKSIKRIEDGYIFTIYLEKYLF